MECGLDLFGKQGGGDHDDTALVREPCSPKSSSRRARTPLAHHPELVRGGLDLGGRQGGWETTPKPHLRRGRRVSGSPEEFDSGWGIGLPTGRSLGALLIWCDFCCSERRQRARSPFCDESLMGSIVETSLRALVSICDRQPAYQEETGWQVTGMTAKQSLGGNVISDCPQHPV